MQNTQLGQEISAVSMNHYCSKTKCEMERAISRYKYKRKIVIVVIQDG